MAAIEGGDLLLEDALVRDNTAFGGAGISIANGRATVRASRIENNTVSSEGGGISVGERVHSDTRQRGAHRESG